MCGQVAEAVVDIGETLADCGSKSADINTQVSTSRADLSSKLRRLLDMKAATPEEVAQAAVHLGADFAPRRARR